MFVKHSFDFYIVIDFLAYMLIYKMSFLLSGNILFIEFQGKFLSSSGLEVNSNLDGGGSGTVY